eukprot:jgi/Bigna1/83833/fgenesh1_pg.116_\
MCSKMAAASGLRSLTGSRRPTFFRPLSKPLHDEPCVDVELWVCSGHPMDPIAHPVFDRSDNFLQLNHLSHEGHTADSLTFAMMLASISGKSHNTSMTTPLAVGVGALILGGAGAAYYYHRQNQEFEQEKLRKEAEEAKLVPLPPEPEAYVHPYTFWPWYSRYYFVFTRTFKLLYIWSPCFYRVIYTPHAFFAIHTRVTANRMLESCVLATEQSGAGFQKFGQWVVARLIAAAADDDEEEEEEDVMIMEDNILFPQGKSRRKVSLVHRGKLRAEYALSDGRVKVAVKVRHPGILDSSYADIWLILLGMKLSPLIGLKMCFPFKEHEFYNNIQKQVDFTWEAYNLLKFNRNFTGDYMSSSTLTVRFPLAPGENLASMLAKKSSRSKVWDEWSRRDNEGVSADMLGDDLTPQEISLRKELAMRCCDIAAKMFLRDNYIHGDLHAGNLLYSAKDNLLTVVDAGLTTFLEDETFTPFGDLLRALCVGDAKVIVEKLVEFNVNEHFKMNDIPDFTADVSAILDKYMGEDRARQEDQLVMGYIMGEVLNTIGKYSITLKGDVSSSLMTISVSEGLVLSLDPSFDLVGRTLP